MAEGARKKDLKALILPEQNALEAASIGGPGTYDVRSLKEAVGLMAGERTSFRRAARRTASR